MYVSRTEISCTPPQWGQFTFNIALQDALRLCTSVSMPVGACWCVVGQVKNREAMCGSFLVQAGARLVSQPPTPGAVPLSVMVEVYSPNIRLSVCYTTPRHFQKGPLANSKGARRYGKGPVPTLLPPPLYPRGECRVHRIQLAN